jgi:hypothetical protein
MASTVAWARAWRGRFLGASRGFLGTPRSLLFEREQQK